MIEVNRTKDKQFTIEIIINGNLNDLMKRI